MDKGFDLKPLLKHISPDDYQTWINVGMALKHEGYPENVWEEWSRGSNKFQEGECENKWGSFNEQALSIVTGATITKLAKDGGWRSGDVANVDYNAVLSADNLKIIDPAFVGDERFEIPTNEKWDPVEDAITFLNALFKPDEYVGFAFSSFKDRDGKRKPKDTGDSYRTCRDIVARLKKYRRIDQAINSYEEEAGAWVRINPLDGEGGSDRNVTDYRYTLVESDEMTLERQTALMKSLELPIAAMTYSGGKSIHAIVHVDADTYKEYQQRVNQIQKICTQNGLKVDVKNKNPSRFSRMPGVVRGESKQFLIATNIGKRNYSEWLEWVQEQNDDLPPFQSLGSVWFDMPPLAPPLIDGVLRQGHKGMLVGPSKCGKSFALMELAIAIAEGRTWLGWQCTQGKVLYVNFEIDDASFFHRFKDLYTALHFPPDHLDNIEVWNLRGHAQSMDKLVPKLIRRSKEQHFVAVIIDPIYKVITGDENAAGDMAKFGNEFDKICRALQTAVIYCHHQSKGSQWGKKAQDRASGSGVFARDPDALIDMTEIPGLDGIYEVNGVLREFSQFAKFDVCFQYPLHYKLDRVYTEDDIAALQLEIKQKKGNAVKSAKADMRKSEMIGYLEARLHAGEPITRKMLAELMQVNEKTIQRWMHDMDPQNKIYGVYTSGEKRGQIYRLQ